MVNRREAILGAGSTLVGVAALGAVAACSEQNESENKTETPSAPAVVKNVKELRMVTSWPKNFPGLGTAARRFGERLERVSDGRFKVQLFGGGELVSPLKCLDAVQEGTADLYHSADYYYVGKSQAFGFFSAVPMGFTANEMDAWILHGGGQQLWDELSAQYNVKAFPCSNTGVQMGGWFKKPINSVEDLRGLKMRMPGLGGKVLKKLGATAVTLGGGDIMPALESGTIDATEWVGPWNDLAFGFYKLAKNYYYPGFHEPGTTLSLGVSKTLYDNMSKSDQVLIESCALAENNYGLAEYNALNASSLTTLINEHGVTLRRFSGDVYQAFGRASREVLQEAAESDSLTKRVYDSFMAFRKNVTSWTALSDAAYMSSRSSSGF